MSFWVETISKNSLKGKILIVFVLFSEIRTIFFLTLNIYVYVIILIQMLIFFPGVFTCKEEAK